MVGWRLRQGWRVARQRLRQRGVQGNAEALRALAAMLSLRAWRLLARPLNRGLLGPLVNARRLRRLAQRLPAPAAGQPRLYVTVMPNVLHFLWPCLRLLRGHAQVVLVANGAKRWERQWLQRRLPAWPMVRLACLPGSSVEHGDVVSLLIASEPGPFGIVDHDCYLLNPALISALMPAPGECAVTLFADVHDASGIVFAQTHALMLANPRLQTLARTHGVDARLYRRTPKAATAAMRSLGLMPAARLKRHQSFHDTLHVLLLLALADGQRLRVVEPTPEPPDQADGDAPLPLAHIGGTSIGSHHTKDLFALYAHLRFIELAGDAELRTRYAALTHPLRDADEALARAGAAAATWQGLPLLDRLLPQLAAALHRQSALA